MRIRTSYDQNREAAVISATSNCYTDALPLVSELFVANVLVDHKSSVFLLGCAVLLRDYCGETIEFEGAKLGSDFGEAVRMALRSPGTVTGINGQERTLALGEIDVAAFPVRLRTVAWPEDIEVPLLLADWSGDFVPRGSYRSSAQAVGHYFTNAGLIADETIVSIAIGLMRGGNRLRRLVVPVAEAAGAAKYERLVEALNIVGVELVLIPCPEPADDDREQLVTGKPAAAKTPARTRRRISEDA